MKNISPVAEHNKSLCRLRVHTVLQTTLGTYRVVTISRIYTAIAHQ